LPLKPRLASLRAEQISGEITLSANFTQVPTQ
jgi:hypothetical protein